MKTTKEHFNLFKDECLKIQKAWQLNGWHLAFEHKEYRSANAAMTRIGNHYNATLCLSKNIDHDKFVKTHSVNDEIKYLAKHEMCHLLLGRLTHVAECRWATETELLEAEEELVRKMCDII